MNEAYFFERVRRAVFGGRLTARQVDGINQILAYRASRWPKMPDDELAYVMATVVHETGFEMQPIRERGGQKYLRSKPYFPFYGRGLVQITWERNYNLFGVTPPDQALEWPVALDICFRGMISGMFTGKKLADYIGNGRCDYIGARRIINGTDRARLVAGYARSFQDAFKQATQTPSATQAPAALSAKKSASKGAA
jgi:hypothetical protein